MEINGIIETCLYAEDLESCKSFYSSLPGIRFYSEEKGRHLFFKTGSGMLLIFNPNETTSSAANDENGKVPSHGAFGPGHVAFTIDPKNLEIWKGYLEKKGIEIEKEKIWPNGARSLYFRDPAGNSLEIMGTILWD